MRRRDLAVRRSLSKRTRHSSWKERVSKKSVVMGFSACGISLRGKHGTYVALSSYTPIQPPLPLNARDRGVAALPSSRQ